MHRMRFQLPGLPHACWLLAGILVTGCSSPTPPAPAAPAATQGWWKGDAVPGAPRLVIDLSRQHVSYYKGGQLVGVSPISSGREGNSTRTGSFRISQKDLHHRSSLYGDYVDASGNVVVSDVDVRRDPRPEGTRFLGANMRYFMRVTGAIGMHEGYLPGYPASHGCIRLPTHMAAAFFHATPLGTPVQVVGHASNFVPEPPKPAAQPPAPRPEPRRLLPAAEHVWLPSVRPPAHARTPKRGRVPPGATLYLEP